MSIESFEHIKKPGHPAKLYIRFDDKEEVRVNLENLIKKEVFVVTRKQLKTEVDIYIKEAVAKAERMPDTDERKAGRLRTLSTSEFKKKAESIVRSSIESKGKNKAAMEKLNSISKRMLSFVNEIYEEVK